MLRVGRFLFDKAAECAYRLAPRLWLQTGPCALWPLAMGCHIYDLICTAAINAGLPNSAPAFAF